MTSGETQGREQKELAQGHSWSVRSQAEIQVWSASRICILKTDAVLPCEEQCLGEEECR